MGKPPHRWCRKYHATAQRSREDFFADCPPSLTQENTSSPSHRKLWGIGTIPVGSCPSERPPGGPAPKKGAPAQDPEARRVPRGALGALTRDPSSGARSPCGSCAQGSKTARPAK